jgi:hypothetical protein
MTRRCMAYLSTIAAFVLLAPGVTWAQSGIAGVVRDTSGAVLPGVTVEAASPALIEKVRTTVTDGDGSYRLLDLRPGTYAVTFSLAGFSTVRRDAVELPVGFTATINADLQVGAIEETITVSGAAPLVDVQNASSQRLISKDLLEAIPASRTPQGFAALTPGVTSQGISVIPGGVNELQTAVHGAPTAEAVYLIDGVNTASMNNLGGGGNVFRISQAYVSEINLIVGGGTAEQQFGGLVTNVIPKEGGNAFSGSVYGEYTGVELATSNLTDELRGQGFTDDSLTTMNRLWDFSPAVGGRILRDKLWFFSSYRNFAVIQSRAGVYDNLTPLGWSYTPDLTRPAEAKVSSLSRNTRLTWQASPRNKISVFADAAPQIAWQRGYTSTARLSPEATNYSPYLPNSFMTASWKSPLTNRWLLDAAVTSISVDFSQRRQTPKTCMCSAPAVGYDVISAWESTTSTEWRSNAQVISGGTNNYGHFSSHAWQYAGNVSYVTGSHAVKGGVQLRRGSQWFTEEPNGGQGFLFRNGVPSSITQWANPIRYENETVADLGLFIQDQWTMKRLTLTGGLRWDYYDGRAKPQDLPEGLWVPARSFPGTNHAPQYSDIGPRIGASYDLFGDGRTAIKATLGRFVFVQTAGNTGGVNANNPVVRSVLNVTRTWNDANGNFNPDCDLRSQLANGECGQISNLNFGQNNPNATLYADELLSGRRNRNWETSLVLQRQLAQGISVTAGYYRRTFANFMTNDNILVGPGDFSTYCITAPVDARLPDGGGYRLCGLYDVSPALFGRNQTVVRSSHHYGEQTQVYDGVDLTENIRLPNGATISGGFNWGRTKTSACFVVDSPQALLNCEVNPPFIPTATFSGLYPLPWLGLVASATYRDYPGPEITASYVVPNAQIAPSLGRNLASGANGTATVPLIAPGTMYGPHARQLDFRLSKRQRIGSRTRIVANLDVFNLFNATGIDRLSTTYGPNWQRPTLLQLGRWVKFSGQVDF